MTRRGVLPRLAQRQWQARQVAKLSADVQRGKISINDARKKMGLEPFPLPECDEKNVPMGD